MRIRCAWTQRATHGTSTGAEPASRAPGGASMATSMTAAAHPRSLGCHGDAPGSEAHGQRGLERRSPAQAGPSSARPTGQPRSTGGAPGDDRPSSYVGSPHTPAPLSPLRWTIMGGHNRMDIYGQGRRGGQKCNGWHHRRVRRLIGFSTTWAGSRRRIGSGRAVGVRGGTLRGPGGWPRRRLAGGMSGWRGMCRRSRLGIVAPLKKMILRRLRVWSGGVGLARTRGGRLTGSRRVGGAHGRRSRASSICRTRARATWRCGWRSGTRSGRGCRGRYEGSGRAVS